VLTGRAKLGHQKIGVGVFLSRVVFPRGGIAIVQMAIALVVGIGDGRHGVEAAEWKEIQKRGYLIVAVKENLRPLGFRNAQGELQGFEIDIAKRLAERLLGSAEAVRWLPVSNQQRLAVVLRGEADMAIAHVTATEMRSRVVSFSLPYYVDGAAAVVKDPTIDSWQELSEATIGVLAGSSTAATVKYFYPEVTLKKVDSYQAGRSLLVAGQADAFAADMSILAGWAQTDPQVSLLSQRLSAQPIAVVIPKGLQYQPLRQQIDRAIREWWESGWLRSRAQHWQVPFSDWRKLWEDRLR
jgi:polar amino acid transport system substrate-binding protein